MNKKSGATKHRKRTGQRTMGKEAGENKRGWPRWSIPVVGAILLLAGAGYLLARSGSQKVAGPAPVPTPKPGDILLIETFDNIYKWGTERTVDSWIDESNGHLFIQTTKPSSFYTIAFLSMAGGTDNSIYLAGGQPQWLQLGNIDLTFETSVEKDAGVATFGAACRFQNDENFYSILLASNGYYGMGKTINGTSILLAKGNSDAIRPAPQTNKVHLICSGNQLSLAVNGKQLATVADISLKKGIIALIGGAGSSGPVDVKVNYDNLVIKAP
jgi:hypothetical protein